MDNLKKLAKDMRERSDEYLEYPTRSQVHLQLDFMLDAAQQNEHATEAALSALHAMWYMLAGELGQPTGSALANKKKSDLAKTTMQEVFNGRRNLGYTKKDAREFANDWEKKHGKKKDGYSKRWLIQHLKD